MSDRDLTTWDADDLVYLAHQPMQPADLDAVAAELTRRDIERQTLAATVAALRGYLAYLDELAYYRDPILSFDGWREEHPGATEPGDTERTIA